MKEKKSSALRFWLLVWGLGLIGQLVWNIENQWFNTFVYAKIAKDPTIISWMVAVSAIATTISTFVFGTMSDRKGRRKTFIGFGYILWGIFTILFGTTEFITGGKGAATAKLLMLAATAVVLADALMSFFGSMGNDAGFNVWLNDNMTEKNRGHIGAALATQPILGTIVGVVLGGMLIGKEDNYMRLFLVFGGLAIVFGIAALVFMKDAPGLAPNRQGSFMQQLLGAFNFREFIKLRELVWVFLTLSVYFIAFNVFYPHVGNYLIYYLGYTPDDIGIILGVVVSLIRTAHDQQRPGHHNPVLAVLNLICKVYITVIRGTPMMVQLLIMGLVIFANSRNFTAVGALTLGINSGAYVSEIIRGGLMSLDPGQAEAGRSLGLNYFQTMRFIVVPQAFKAILPALGNEFIILLKDTSLITVIGGKELLYAARGVMNRTYEQMFPLLGTAAIYLVLVIIFSWLLGKLERRLRQSDRR